MKYANNVKKFKTKLILCLFIIGLCCLSGEMAFAQTVRDLTLSEAIEIAQKDSKVWGEFDAREQSARMQLKVAESHWWPVVSVDASVIYWSHESRIDVVDKEELKTTLSQSVSDGVSTLDPAMQVLLAGFLPVVQSIGESISDVLPSSVLLKQQFTTTVGATVAMPLTPLFKVYQANKLAQVGIDNVDVERRAKQLEITHEVTDVYLKLVYAQMMYEVANEALDTIQKHVELAQKYESVGMIQHSDVLTAQVELVKARQKVVEAKNGMRLAGMKLGQVLALGRGVEIHASNMPQESYKIELESLESYQTKALEQRPELQRISLGEEAADRKRKMALMDYIPQVMLIGRYQFNYGIDALYPKNQAFVGLGMTWTLFDGLGHYYESQMAELSSSELSSKDAEARELIELEVGQKYLNLSTALERIDLTDQALELAEENLRTINAQFEHGESVNTEVLAAQTRRTAARADRVKARIDILSAYSELLLSLGEDPALDTAALE